MSCPDLELLDRHAREQLPEAQCAVVSEHVSTCVACRDRLALVRDNLRVAARVPLDSDGVTQTVPAPAANPPPPSKDSSLPPDSFPGYQILREISRGGQGVVYQAIQRSTRRKVAIKVLREGHFADTSERARFEREVQILGQLKHSNIVSIYDSGSVGGNAFYVMDYVSGKPLDEYVQNQGRRDEGTEGRRGGSKGSRDQGIKGILELFRKVCDAVHEAHLKGIIHRDLKPSNIRVDTNGEPHVLDFGLAKLAGAAELSHSPAMTMTGQFLGSLPWSSPEQAEGQPSKIDIRTDVYSLGVILYQLLTGRFPYDVNGNMRDVLDRIMHAEPTPPRRVAHSHGAQSSSAVSIAGEAPALPVDDEVETIILKCLAKERERRYQSAGELARDIEHYLAGEPIEAKRDSGWYVIRKVMQRHRTPVAVSAAFLLLLAVSTVVAAMLYFRADEQRARADSQRTVAEKNAQQLNEVVAFQSSMLNGLDPHRMGSAILQSIRDQLHATMNSRGRAENIIERRLRNFDDAVGPLNCTDLAQSVLAAQLLTPLEGRIQTEFSERPELEAALRHIVAETYARLGLYSRALDNVNKALELRRAVLGNEHLDTLASVLTLSKITRGYRFTMRAEQPAREALSGFRKVAGNDDPRTLDAIATLGGLLADLSKLDEAEELSRELLHRRSRLSGTASADTMTALRLRGEVLMVQDRLDEAEKCFATVLEWRSAKLGPQHPDTLEIRMQLGILCRWLDRFAEAETLMREVIDVQRRVFGETHPETVGARQQYAFVLAIEGRLDESEAIYRNNQRIMLEQGDESATANYSLATVARWRGNFAGAEKLYRESIQATSEEVPSGHRWRAIQVGGLGACIAHQGRFVEAEPLLLEAAENTSRQAVARHYRREFVQELAFLYESWHAAESGRGYDKKAAEWRAKLEALQPTTQRASSTTTAPRP